MHMKESKGNPSTHLQNAINYILDVKHGGAKTDYGKWVGGNSGIDADEVFKNFMDTKAFYEKFDGRQGYHFAISFAKGETDAETCFEIMGEFCEEFLKDNYDYVYAVHTDKGHMHGHIIFNSVARTTGLKYHYVKGDWEKYIQPITDKICERHNLETLTFEEKRVGVSYAKWNEKKGNIINWTSIIRADIDFAIQKSDSMEEFLTVMKQMNYTLRFGRSLAREENYITFTFTDDEGKIHRRRSYKLGKSYNLEGIKEKILHKKEISSFKEVTEVLEEKTKYVKPNAIIKGTQTYRRMYQAVSYYKLPNPFAVPQGQVRRDMIRIEKLIENCEYIKRTGLSSTKELEERSHYVEERLHQDYINRKVYKELYDQVLSGLDKTKVFRYKEIQLRIRSLSEYDKEYEDLEEELLNIEKELPFEFMSIKNNLYQCEREIEKLKKEKKILQRIISTEKASGKIIETEMKTLVP